MTLGAERDLTAGERGALSPGLIAALDEAGVRPVVVARASLLASIAGLWRSRTPVLTLHERIFWPGALTEFAGVDEAMSVLQHELQHVLDYATGALTMVGYACRPSNWRYRYELAPGCRWRDFGAEQRACIAEDYWRLERAGALAGDERPLIYQALIPWTGGR